MPTYAPLAAAMPLGYKTSPGGVKTIYLTDFANVSAITAAGGVISAITMNSTTKFYEFAVRKETADFTEKVTVNAETGSNYADQSLKMTLTTMEAAKRQVIQTLSQGLFIAIVVTNAGDAYLLGEKNGLDLTDSTGTTGTKMADMNGYTLNFKGAEMTPAQQIADLTIVTALL